MKWTEKDSDLDVKHVKAHRTEKENKDKTRVQKICVEGNEKACETAMEGARMWIQGTPSAPKNLRTTLTETLLSSFVHPLKRRHATE